MGSEGGQESHNPGNVGFNCKETDQELDEVIINFVCDELLPDYNINKPSLKSWQVELIDNIHDSEVLAAIIEEEIILGNPINNRKVMLSYDKIQVLFAKLEELTADVYIDFKLLILELLNHVLTSNFTCKILSVRENIHKLLIHKWLQYLSSNEPVSVVEKLDKTILSLLELGCDNKTLRLIVTKVFQSNSVDVRLHLLTFLNKLFKLYQCHFKFLLFNDFVNSPTPIPLDNSNRFSSKLFSIQSWFKINNSLTSTIDDDLSITTLFNISNSSNSNVSSFKLQLVNYNQFMIEIRNNVNNSKIQFSFNQILNTEPNDLDAYSNHNQGFTHVVLTFDKFGNLNLFINGEYSESIPCFDLLKSIDQWDKIYIGDVDFVADNPIKTCTSKDELMIQNLTIFNTNLSPQWINLFYNMGLGHEWNFKELSEDNVYNLLNHLSFRGLTNLALKLNEMSGNKKKRSNLRESFNNLTMHVHYRQPSTGESKQQATESEINTKGSDNSNKEDYNAEINENDVENKRRSKPFSKRTLSNGIIMKNLIDKHNITNSLLSSKILDTNVVFDSNDNEFLNHLESPSANGSKIYLHESESIYGAFYIIGGTQLILTLIESVINNPKLSRLLRDNLLQKSLALLFSLLNNNWRLSKEFENINGYGILSVLLTNYKLINKTLVFELGNETESRDIEDDGNEFSSVLFVDEENNLFKLLLKNIGYDFKNPSESIIINPMAYKFLILNFDIFHDSNSFNLLLTQLNTFMIDSKYYEFNIMELNKMKLLKKLLHFIKNPNLTNVEFTHEINEQFIHVVSIILRSDTSVETIKALAHFIVYSFYSSSQECNPKLGLLALQSLTDFVCEQASVMKVLKKFSRSITIHWILLLLNISSVKHLSINSKDVVKCGIRLLAKLLKVLGPHIIKKFFYGNRGLDILTHFLKDWWSNDELLCLIYLASFGLDIHDFEDEDGILDEQYFSLTQIIPPSNSITVNSFSKLFLPEFLNLLNNLVLNSVYTLSERKGKVLSAPNSPNTKNSNIDLDISLDAIHLISSYSIAIEKGYQSLKPLSNFYIGKKWLEGIFELIGYLRLFLTWENSDLLVNFKNCYNRLAKIISDIFISKLFNSGDFFNIFNNLNDFTKKLILDIVFPKIFKHINEFISVSNFIFNEKEFINESISILMFYYDEYLDQNFLINDRDLSDYITCVLSILEIKQKSSSSSVKHLKSYLGNLIILKLRKDSEDSKAETDWVNIASSVQDNDGDSIRTALNVNLTTAEMGINKFNESIKLILYRQVIIFQTGILSTEELGRMLILLMGNFFKYHNNTQQEQENQIHLEYFFNLLRSAHMMRQDEFGDVIDYICKDIDYSASHKLLEEFFNTLLVKNDEETLKSVSKFPTLKHIFNQSYYSLLSKTQESSKLNIHDMISITLNNGGTLGQLDNIYIKSFERDCIQLKNRLLNNELTKFNRTSQDHKENILYFVSSYNALKVELERLICQESLSNTNYVLDFIENSDRIRNRMIIEDQLSDSEKLAYQIDIPVKNVESLQNDKSLESYNYVIGNNGINTLSLSTDEVLLELGGEDSFEVVDDNEVNDSAYEDKNRKVLRSLYLGDHIVSLWNISQINGLAPIESLMILGSNHLYIIENYLHQPDGNVIDVQDAPIELRDPYLQLVNSQSNYFTNDARLKSHKSKSWSLDTLSSISKRQFLLRDIALEMFFTDGASILVTCISSKDRDTIYNKLHHFCVGKGLDQDLSQTLQLSSSLSSLNNNNSTSYFASKLSSVLSSNNPDNFLAATKKWKAGEMSNFYYLMIINTLAGRTFNDLTQYPVFPWVIADYASETLDLSNPKTFRDLSKPMGAQTEPRASEFRERFEALQSLEDASSPAFHYGTHYSSAMIVTSFLIRLKPYVHSYLLLQGGKFDHADRLFNSIEKAWFSASKENTTDVRELIPEFFYLPEFLTNSNNFELGVLQSGESPNNVDLPTWAHGDPKIFIQKNREALESPYVSANLHLWIDLIFGYKQSGTEAIEALNIFHHLSYNGAINLDNINDEMERKAVIGMINNFGQTPKKIFNKPHTQRDVLNLPNYYFTPIDDREPPNLVFESKLRSPIKKIEVSSKSGKWVGRPQCVCSEDDLLIRKIGNINDNSRSIIINNTSFLDIHRSFITNILQIGYKMFVTASDDGLINIWKCNVRPVLNLQFQGVLRGHVSPIKELKFNKSSKVGLSSDVDGNVILWDFTRFKFIRKFVSQGGAKDILIDISNDSDNIAIVDVADNSIKLFTLNGDAILETALPKGGTITSIKFGSINGSKVETGNHLTSYNHSYWSEELISVAYGGENRAINIFSLKPEENSSNWRLTEFCHVSLQHESIGDITAYELFKKNVVDPEDRLTRGYLELVMGDVNGRVYQW